MQNRVQAFLRGRRKSGDREDVDEAESGGERDVSSRKRQKLGYSDDSSELSSYSDSSGSDDIPTVSVARKVPVRAGEFGAGNIVRLHVEGFMNHSLTEVFPSPGLNYVIGSNGSGKSALMCAIMLGLGANPNLLDRGKEVGSFVMYGRSSARIEIDICVGKGKRDVLKVSREFDRQNHSKWLLNGRNTSQKIVERAVRSFGVAVDSLCNFLPQKRVAEFARFRASDLLKKLLEVINPLLLETLEEILRVQEVLSQRGHAKDADLARLTSLRGETERLRVDKERFERRDAYTKELVLAQKKLPWLEYDEARKSAIAAKRKLVEIQKDREEIEQRVAPLRSRYESLIAEVRKLDLDRTAAKAEVLRHRRELERYTDDIDTHEIEAEAAKKQIEDAEQEAEKLVARIAECRSKLAAAERLLAAMAADEDLKRQEEEIMNAQRDLRKEFAAVRAPLDFVRDRSAHLHTEELHLQKRIAELNTIQEQRRLALVRSQRDVEGVMNHLSANRKVFRAPVFGPLILELSVTEQSSARLVESLIPRHLVSAIVCSTAEDRRRLRVALYDTMKAGVTIIETPEVESRPRVTDISALKQRGLLCWVDELLKDCPVPVHRVLAVHAMFDRVAVGTREAESHLDWIFNHTPIRTVVCPTGIFSRERSRYGNRNLIVNARPLEMLRYLKAGMGGEEEEQVRSRMKEIVEEIAKCANQESHIQKDEADIRRREVPLRARREENMKQRRDRDAWERKTRFEKQSLAHLEREQKNLQGPESLRAEARAKIVRSVVERTKIASAVVGTAERWVEETLKSDRLELTWKDQKSASQSAKRDFEQIEMMHRRVTQEFEGHQKAYDEAVVRARELKGIAEAGGELSEEEKALFRDNPETLDDLKGRIYDLQTRINAIFADAPNIVEIYEKKLAQLGVLEAQVEIRRQELQDVADREKKLSSEWESEAKAIVLSFSESFSLRMKSSGVVGEAHLAKTKGAQGKTQYELELACQFRSEGELQRISTHELSGGERALVTTMFICALQSMCSSPLRVADELNQGMDVRNERLSFQAIQSATESQNGSQFFLVTPKLVPGLEYSEHTTVLVVFSGPHVSPDLAACHTKGKLRTPAS